MIIPRSPGPEASDDEGLEGLSLDDIRRLARERLADVKVSYCMMRTFVRRLGC